MSIQKQRKELQILIEVVQYIQLEYADVTVGILEAVIRRCSVKKVLLEIWQNSQQNTRVRISFLMKYFIEKETLAQVISCEFCEFFKNIEHLQWQLLVFIFCYVFFCLFLFSVVIIFNDWLLLGKSYSNVTTLSKVINNQTKQNFPRFPSFRFWV